MRRFTSILSIVLVGLAAAGCASSPWSSRKPAAPAPAAASPPTATAATPAPAAAAQPSPELMLAAMTELQQIGDFDQAAQARLLADLKQTDPSLWPMVIQQVRAMVAYRRRADERALAGGTAPNDPTGATPVVASALASAVGPPSAPPPSGAPAYSHSLQRLPPVDSAGALPGMLPGPATVYPGKDDPGTVQPPIDARRLPPPGEHRAATVADDQVRQVSYEVPASGNWQTWLDKTIVALEAEAPASPQTQEDFARLARLRMMYLLAGRRDAAVQPIPSAPPASQEFLSKSLYGLATWLDVERTPDAARRSAEAKQAMEEAAEKLGAAAPLVVRNLAFCTEIQSYGCYRPFKGSEFSPEQELLLYAEVQNFASESTAKGYHTALRSSYQVFDAHGQRVAEHDFTVTEEHCQNHRRDFFIGYHLRLPKRIYAGKHTLQLTVEDLKSHKIGQSQIDFTVKEPK